ncbi:(2Fe-2S)-binding protein, partial [bacterium]|nr:(2Fe-2S)-binding protein [candidate division CSSED10-310 bacterium]
MERITLTIDGREISAASGQTILEAALEHGIHIPTLCWHPKLSPIGACRVCLVRVHGEERLVASCQVPVTDGMVVVTNDPEIVAERRKALSYALVDHPLDCGMCDKSGECELQDRTVELGLNEPIFPRIGYNKGLSELSPLIELCNTRCIACGRCIQICQEVQGARAIDYVVQEGCKTVVGPTVDDGYPCESCGQCITVCPCGVILDRTFKHHARAYELAKTVSICPYCSLGCLLQLNHHHGVLRRVTPLDREWLNQGNLCLLGRFAWDTATAEPDASYDAIQVGTEIGHRLEAIRDKYSGKAVAVLAGTEFYNEDYDALQLLARQGLQSPHLHLLGVESNLAFRRVLAESFGIVASPASLDDLRRADRILVLNSDLVEAFPVAALELIQGCLRRGTELTTVGYRMNKLTDISTRVIRNQPNSDHLLLAALLKLMQEGGSGIAANERDAGRLARISADQLAGLAGVTIQELSEVA